MEIKGRLNLIADKVPVCEVLCDVGTDHAYLPVYLIKQGKCGRIIASDAKAGPIRVARKNITLYGMEDKIETRLGYGIETIEENEADVIVIAGMGGELIVEILRRGIKKAKRCRCLILQAMNSIDILHRWLYENGFNIYDEELAVEGEKIYCVICAKWTGEEGAEDCLYYYIGKKLVEKHDPLLPAYIKKSITRLDKAISSMKEQTDKWPDILGEYENLNNRMKTLLGEVCKHGC